ncbi:hypothetical protein B0H11DRAFT_1932976 [Mycena galericulata]|nr:hypothetical protein B0H11DRAFT_1932976 [Mycena galericulata]
MAPGANKTGEEKSPVKKLEMSLSKNFEMTCSKLQNLTVYAASLLGPLEDFLANPPLPAHTHIPREPTSGCGRPSYVLDLLYNHFPIWPIVQYMCHIRLEKGHDTEKKYEDEPGKDHGQRRLHNPLRTHRVGYGLSQAMQDKKTKEGTGAGTRVKNEEGNMKTRNDSESEVPKTQVDRNQPRLRMIHADEGNHQRKSVEA